MSKWIIEWSPEAQADLHGIVEFIVIRGDATNATRIFDRLVARVESLANTPERGRKVPEMQLPIAPSLREVIVRPWRILYACEDGRVVIAAIIDGRRNVVAALEGRFDVGLRESS